MFNIIKIIKFQFLNKKEEICEHESILNKNYYNELKEFSNINIELNDMKMFYFGCINQFIEMDYEFIVSVHDHLEMVI